MFVPLMLLAGTVLGGLAAPKAAMALAAGAKAVGETRRARKAQKQRRALAESARSTPVEEGEIQFTDGKK